MFEWLTKQARKAAVLAREEARRLNHDLTGTQHLLLGLLRYDEGVAARALSSLGVSLNEAREQVESMVGRGDGRDIGQEPFTPRSKQVLDGALKEALLTGHNYVNTEHVLLGLTNDPDGIAMHVLSRLGVDPNEIHREVAGIVGGQAAERRPAADPEDSKYA